LKLRIPNNLAVEVDPMGLGSWSRHLCISEIQRKDWRMEPGEAVLLGNVPLGGGMSSEAI
jgi:hypothetical protein